MNSSNAKELFPSGDTTIPRFREAGDLTLDLFHRDGRVDATWLGLRPREFELLWHLAAKPGELMSRDDLSSIFHSPEPDRDRLVVLIAGVRAALMPVGLDHMLVADAEGGYMIDAPPGPSAYVFGQTIGS